jgi:hypothetical protein
MYGPSRGTPSNDTISHLTDYSFLKLKKSKAEVAETLQQGLLRKMPPPDVLQGGEAALAREVAAFVQDLLKVVHLKLLTTPVNKRKETPADCVGSSGIGPEVDSVLGLIPTSATPTRLFRAVKARQDERDERLRERHATQATPTRAYLALAVVLPPWRAFTIGGTARRSTASPQGTWGGSG